MPRLILAALVAGLLISCANVATQIPPTTAALPAVQLSVPPQERDPSDLQILFWSPEQRSARFREMEEWFPGVEVSASRSPRPLPSGAPLPADLVNELNDFMTRSGAAGLMVLQDGRKRFEAYGQYLAPSDRWTSFSVAKSFTSTLLGAAIKDGHIGSLQDDVTRYIPELAGSAYDNVTVEQLATMTSGVKWDESYTNPRSDVARISEYLDEYGENAIIAQMKALEREAEPGKKWVYKTGETNLLGLLVERAVGRPLAAYAKAKIVDPAGFEGDLFWMVYPGGINIGGCCLSLRLADYARIGQFALEGGDGIVPNGWFAAAGAPQVQLGDGFGYGYQWWTYPGDSYGAQGIFGQAVTIVPDKNLVVAIVSNWPTATSETYRRQFRDLVTKIVESQ